MKVIFVVLDLFALSVAEKIAEKTWILFKVRDKKAVDLLVISYHTMMLIAVLLFNSLETIQQDLFNIFRGQPKMPYFGKYH